MRPPTVSDRTPQKRAIEVSSSIFKVRQIVMVVLLQSLTDRDTGYMIIT